MFGALVQYLSLDPLAVQEHFPAIISYLWDRRWDTSMPPPASCVDFLCAVVAHYRKLRQPDALLTLLSQCIVTTTKRSTLFLPHACQQEFIESIKQLAAPSIVRLWPMFIEEWTKTFSSKPAHQATRFLSLFVLFLEGIALTSAAYMPQAAKLSALLKQTLSLVSTYFTPLLSSDTVESPQLLAMMLTVYRSANSAHLTFSKLAPQSSSLPGV